MKNKTGLIVVGLLLVAVVIAASLLYDRLLPDFAMGGLAVTAPTPTADAVPTPAPSAAPSATPSPSAIPLAPNFTVYDAAGSAHRLSDFRGKPVVLNFWASWCGPCTGEMPAFQECYRAYSEDIHFLMVNLTDGNGETVESASRFIADAGYTFPVYFDTDYSAAMAYGVSSIPASYFISAEGYPVAYGLGALREEDIRSGIDMLLIP